MLSPRAALAILNEAKLAEVYQSPVPEDEATLLSEAQLVLDQANLAAQQGMKATIVETVIKISESDEFDQQIPPVQVNSNGTTEPVSMEEEDARHNHHSFVGALTAKEQAVARIKKENLPIPPELEGQPPILPRDMSTLSDGQIRKLHAEYTAALARANWICSLEQADEYAAKMIAEKLEVRALAHVDKIKYVDDKPKPKSIPEIEAEAKEHPDVVAAWDAYTELHMSLRIMKELKDSMQVTCERISREWSMREAERQFSAH